MKNTPIPVLTGVTAEEFREKLQPARKPCVLRGLDLGTCVERWKDPEYLKSKFAKDQGEMHGRHIRYIRIYFSLARMQIYHTGNGILFSYRPMSIWVGWCICRGYTNNWNVNRNITNYKSNSAGMFSSWLQPSRRWVVRLVR